MTVDWKRPLGEPCTLWTGALLEGLGYVEYGVTLLRDQPHSTRKLRTAYGR